MSNANNAVEIRDDEGFLCLFPVNGHGYHEPSVFPKYKNGIGEHALVKNDDTVKHSAKSKIRISFDDPYSVEYAPKTWQRKAWELVGDGIDWKAESKFKDYKGNKKFRHIKRIGIAMKVRVDDRKSSRPVIAQLALTNQMTKCMYVKIDDPKNFSFWMNRLNQMVEDRTFIESYLKKAEKLGYHSIAYIMKAIIIYDDKTYDTLTGNPLQIADLLDIKYKNGKVVLTKK